MSNVPKEFEEDYFTLKRVELDAREYDASNAVKEIANTIAGGLCACFLLIVVFGFMLAILP